MSKGYKWLFALGLPFSLVYSALMIIRTKCYKIGIFRQHRLPVPVVSIGNITMGGTGKTPMVMYVCRLLQNAGKQPAVVSRGYGGKAKNAVNIVSSTTEVLLQPDAAGDEPRLLADSLPGVPVLTGVKRYHPAQVAINQFYAGVIVLDDGFQHLALQRDLNIALFNASSPLGNGRVFPGGEMREPFSSLNRATAFVITGVDQDMQKEIDSFKDNLQSQFPGRPVFIAEYKVTSLLDNQSSDAIALEKGKKIKLYGFCGLANPQSFLQTLRKEAFSIAGFRAFEDHRPYTTEDIAKLINVAKKSGAQGLITTEKDFVKIRGMKFDLPILTLKIELTLGDAFDRFVLEKVG